jgi:NTP pyrophosphatase (non-canonical NTP hydrolase)
MTERFVSPCPPPTPFEAELLQILAEECAEVTQRCMKALRFGLDERQPNHPLTNAERISEELGDLLATMDRLLEYDILSRASIEAARESKPFKLDKYMQTEAPTSVSDREKT